MRNIIIVLLIGIILGGAVAFFLLSQKNNQANQTATTISGTLDINGVVPENSTISLSAREAGSKSDYTTVAENITPTNHTAWQFTTATSGKSYEIQASLIQGTKTIAHSDPIYITAPATEETLSFNIESEAASSTPATISGTVGLNGYIPDGATITIQGRLVGKQEFTTVVKDLPAKDGQLISYTTAVAGKTYEVVGMLYDNTGVEIGKSQMINITAPATEETLDINSVAKPPVTPTPTQSPTRQPTPKPITSSISGAINFNGAPPPNSRIVIFQRPAGTSNFQVAQDNINPQNGATWQWNGATTGNSYDLIAILKQKQSNNTDKDISTSSTITVSAPAANEQFTINSGYTLSAAGGSISVNCGNRDGGSNSWNATVSFQSISGAASYWYQIGTTNGGIELTNFTQNASNNQNQSFNYTFQNGVTYFARYAYSTAQNLSAGSSQFSPFSGTTQLRCSQ